MSHPEGISRRERLRAETLAEIKQHAEAQLAEGGPEAVSLSAIARAMRMSGPALYRYFASRDALLTSLVTDSYDALAHAIRQALGEAVEQRSESRVDADRATGAGEQFRAVADAYRRWAIAHPHRYQLIFASSYGSGLLHPDQTIPAAHQNMEVLLKAVAGLSGMQPERDRRPSSGDHLQAWVDARPGLAEVPPATLELAVQAWIRLHGVVGLEINGVFASMGINPGELFATEVEDIIDRTRAPHRPRKAGRPTRTAKTKGRP